MKKINTIIGLVLFGGMVFSATITIDNRIMPQWVSEKQRTNTIFDAGELVWVTNTTSVYLGDGIKKGGVFIGNSNVLVRDYNGATITSSTNPANYNFAVIRKGEAFSTSYVSVNQNNFSVSLDDGITANKNSVTLCDTANTNKLDTPFMLTSLGRNVPRFQIIANNGITNSYYYNSHIFMGVWNATNSSSSYGLPSQGGIFMPKILGYSVNYSFGGMLYQTNGLPNGWSANYPITVCNRYGTMNQSGILGYDYLKVPAATNSHSIYPAFTNIGTVFMDAYETNNAYMKVYNGSDWKYVASSLNRGYTTNILILTPSGTGCLFYENGILTNASANIY